mgnify:CR=1 FL=1
MSDKKEAFMKKNRKSKVSLYYIKNNIIGDIGIIIISIIVAINLVRTGTLSEFLNLTKGILFLDSFIAGMFFTSAFTTAPSIVTLGEIARSFQSVFLVAFFGSLGAMCGDLIIFRFMRNTLGEDINYLFSIPKSKRLTSIFKTRFFKWFTFLLGAFIIASPLPDEVGVMMMGFSKIKTSLFILISFVFNFLGILAVGLVARTL